MAWGSFCFKVFVIVFHRLLSSFAFLVCLVGLVRYVVWVGHLRLLVVVIAGSLLNYLVVLSAFDHSNLAEVRQKVGPHYVVLVDVGALNLGHRNKVVSQQ